MNVRDQSQSLAKINIKQLDVSGHMNMNGAIYTEAWLQDMVLEDSRPQIDGEILPRSIKGFLGFPKHSIGF